MKKTVLFFGLLLFFCCLFEFKTSCFCYAEKSGIDNISYTFLVDGKFYRFESNNFLNDEILSKEQIEIFKKIPNRFSIFSKLQKMGLTKREIIDYCFPELKNILKQIQYKTNTQGGLDDIEVVLNKCQIRKVEGGVERFLDLEKFYHDFYDLKGTTSKEIFLKINIKTYKNRKDIMTDYVEKACFSTNFATSSKERKTNIKTARAKFDGVVLDIGEVLSFNKTTGKRIEENGYCSAKIISDGTFVEGVGGGVCQVSTTLYNACLIAGLEIVEVHQHSLPVSYVEPSFDAMVNTGSSDLVIKNNTGGKLIFTTSNIGDKCMFKIYGKPNQFKIERKSEKTKTIPASENVLETDYRKYNISDIEIGEQRRISYAKDGYHSKGYLNYFDDKGVLIKSQKIREDRYGPVKGVVVKREN